MITSKIKKEAGHILLDRAEKRNALNLEMVSSLIRTIGELNGNPGVKCIVLKAAGPVFCAGADIKELGCAGNKGINYYADLVDCILTSPKPVIARVQGPVFAGGVGLIAACHLAAGSEAATFITPELKSDLFPLMVYALISEKAGSKLTLEMALCEKKLSSHEAVEAGLLNTVVTSEKLDETVEGWAEKICAWNPEVVAAGLGTIHEIRTRRLIELVRTCQKTIDFLDGKRSMKKVQGRRAAPPVKVS